MFKKLTAVCLLIMIAWAVTGCDLLTEPIMYEIDFAVEGDGSIIMDNEENYDDNHDLTGKRRSFAKDSTFQLSAEDSDGWRFQSWLVDGNFYSSQPSETFTAERENQQIKAVFVPREYELNVEIIGDGSGDVKQELIVSPHAKEYPYGSKIELTAVADENSEFVEWSGDIQSEEDVVEIEMDENKNVKAKFDPVELFSISGNIDIEHNFPYAVVDDYPYSTSSQNQTAVDSGSDRLTTNFEAETQSLQEAGEYSELVVGYDDELTSEQARDLLQNKGFEIVKLRPEMSSAVVEIGQMKTADEVDYAGEELAASEDILYAEPNYRYYAQTARYPQDEHFGMQWHYPQVRLPQAWTQTTGDSSVRIAVLDTGVDTGHPDLGDNIAGAAGYNVLEDSDDYDDGHGHGTHVAGTIAANTDNNEGVAGVMWSGTVIPVKVLGDYGSGTLDEVAAGIYYAAGLSEEAPDDFASLPENPYPADVINLSLGGYDESQHLKEAVNEASEAGVLLVAASGNDGERGLMYPAAYDNVLAVGAVDFNYPNEPEMTGYTNYGPDLDLLAPGGDISVDSNSNEYADGVWSTFFDSYEYLYGALEGTSMAAPHVSGVLGLMLSRGISPEEAEDVLKNTAMDLESTDYSSGLLNAYWAINEVENIYLQLLNEEDEIVRDKKLPLSVREFYWEEIPPGEYRVKAKIDVRESGEIDSGDYKSVVETIEASEEEEIELEIILQEQD